MSLIQPGKNRTSKRRPAKKAATRRPSIGQKAAYRRFGATCPLCRMWIPKDINLHKEKIHGEQTSAAWADALKKKKAQLLEQEKKAKAELAAAEEIRRGGAKQRPLYDRSTAGTKWGADPDASALRPKKSKSRRGL